jgi:hypothetical protein
MSYYNNMSLSLKIGDHVKDAVVHLNLFCESDTIGLGVKYVPPALASIIGDKRIRLFGCTSEPVLRSLSRMKKIILW